MLRFLCALPKLLTALSVCFYQSLTNGAMHSTHSTSKQPLLEQSMHCLQAHTASCLGNVEHKATAFNCVIQHKAFVLHTHIRQNLKYQKNIR